MQWSRWPSESYPHINFIYTGGSGKEQSGLTPRALVTILLTWSNLGAVGNSQFKIESLSQVFDMGIRFRFGRKEFSYLEQFSFQWAEDRGRSGHTFMLLSKCFSFRAPSSHLFRWLRSRKRIIMPASFLRDRRWHVAKSDTAASSMSMC